MSKEIRQIITTIELRQSDDGQNEYIEGYALKFEKWSELLGWGFKEIISRGSLDECDFSDVVALFNHNINQPLARNSVKSGTGSLQLEVDSIGLKFKFIPTDTSYARDLKENMKAGIVDKCSFAFYVSYDEENSQEWEWDTEEGFDKRRINKIAKIDDISIVVKPAYKDTESVVSERCLEVKKQRDQELKKQKENEILKQKIQIELELLNK